MRVPGHSHRTRSRRAPGPRGNPLLGSLLDVRADRLGFLMRLTRDFGEIARFRIGPGVFHVVNHPDWIQHVLSDNASNYHKGIGLTHARSLLGDGLLTSEGEVWRRQRKAVNRAFARDHSAAYADVMIRATAEMISGWGEARAGERTVAIASEATRLTLRILGRAMLGTELGAEAPEAGRAFRVATDYAIARMTALFDATEMLPTPRNLKYRRALAVLDHLVDDLIEERAEESTLLSSLLRSPEKGGPAPGEARQLRDEVMTVLLAGHETTANTVTWACDLLSRHPAIQDELARELDAVLGSELPTYESLKRLDYTRSVVLEVLRLYPPVWIIPRRALAEDTLGGFTIPSGSGVLVSPYATHRHPDLWNEPERFDPGRFTGKSPAAYVYLPFGAGPRQCVGREFAMLECVTIIAMIATRYRMTAESADPALPEASLTLRPRADLRIVLSPRAQSGSLML